MQFIIAYGKVKILMKMVDGSTKMENYTYGKNVPEIINFSDKNNNSYTGEIYNTGILNTFLKNHFLLKEYLMFRKQLVLVVKIHIQYF